MLVKVNDEQSTGTTDSCNGSGWSQRALRILLKQLLALSDASFDNRDVPALSWFGTVLLQVHIKHDKGL